MNSDLFCHLFTSLSCTFVIRGKHSGRAHQQHFSDRIPVTSDIHTLPYTLYSNKLISLIKTASQQHPNSTDLCM